MFDKNLTCLQIVAVELKHEKTRLPFFKKVSTTALFRTHLMEGGRTQSHNSPPHLHPPPPPPPSSPPRPPGHSGVTMSRTNTARSADDTSSASRRSALPPASQNALRSDIWADQNEPSVGGPLPSRAQVKLNYNFTVNDDGGWNRGGSNSWLQTDTG